MTKYSIHIHPTGEVFLEEGFYTQAELEKILECIERQNKHIQQAMEPSK